MPAKELRKDITGLRAIAVLSVMFFHIAHVLAPDNNYFKGGFLGVDIFFVISGFLMTKIIMACLDQENFSLYGFYKHRAKRICPALAVIVLLFCFVSYSIFDSDYVKLTFRRGFLSNFPNTHGIKLQLLRQELISKVCSLFAQGKEESLCSLILSYSLVVLLTITVQNL